MNRVTFTICCVLLLSSQAVGLAPIGPASSGLDQGQFAIGTEYVKGDFMTGFENSIYTYSGLGPVRTVRQPGKIPAEVDLDGFLGKLSYGLTDRCLVFARIGQVEIDSEKDFTWGLGTKMTVAESETIDLGLTAQIIFLTNEENLDVPGFMYAEGKADFSVAQVAIGPVYKSVGFCLYGGPFFAWVNGDGDITGRFVLGETPVDVKASFDVKRDIELGVYIGMSIELVKNLDVLAEYQLANDWDMFGAGLSFEF